MTKPAKTAEEQPQPAHNPWPPAPLPDDAATPGLDHSKPIPWPPAGGPDDAKPYKNLR